MSVKKTSEKDDDAIRFENEFLKAKIKAETGALNVLVFPGKKVSPEIENELLKLLASDVDEEELDDIEDIPIYDFIGRPDYINENDLSDEQIPIELEYVNGLLDAKNIIYSVLPSVDDRMVYKFVTEDLFQHPILNLPDSEIGSHYFYENFHPDHEYDSRKTCEEFIDVYFSCDFDKRIRDLSMEDIRNFAELCEFHDAFEEFTNVKFEIIDADVAPVECIRKATISFDALKSAGIKPIHFEGEAIFELEYENKSWTVIVAQFPGMTEATYATM